MQIDSFTDEQLLNFINTTILEETDFNTNQITGGYVQATTSYKNKFVTYKVTFLFGYDKNKNSRQHQKEISRDVYFIWCKAMLLKTLSLIIDNTGSELNEMNRRMNKKSEKDEKGNGKGIGKGVLVVGRGRTTSSTTIVLPSETEIIALKVSEYLLAKIITNNPKFKQPNLQTWAKDIDRAIRIDHRTEQELIGCIDWIYTDSGSFWEPNILSGKKLREKFDTMQAQSRSKSKKSETMVDKIYDSGLTAQEVIKQMEMNA